VRSFVWVKFKFNADFLQITGLSTWRQRSNAVELTSCLIESDVINYISATVVACLSCSTLFQNDWLINCLVYVECVPSLPLTVVYALYIVSVLCVPIFIIIYMLIKSTQRDSTL
jgi:hypothetical protein